MGRIEIYEFPSAPSGFFNLRSHRSRGSSNSILQTPKSLASTAIKGTVANVSALEVIEQIKELPPAERAQVAKFIVEHEDFWIPDEFKAAMKDADAGGFIAMEIALQETPPPRLQ